MSTASHCGREAAAASEAGAFGAIGEADPTRPTGRLSAVGEALPSETASARRAARRCLLRDRPVMVVVGDPTPAEEVVPLVRRLLKGGADLLELRLKRADLQTRGRVAAAVAAVCARAGALLLVNGDPALARAAGADGAHVGQSDEAPPDARRLLGDDRLLGLSVHGPDEARAAYAQRRWLDYVGVGTIFRSQTKPGLVPCGTPGLQSALRHLGGLPVYAIGGVGLEGAAACVQAGAHGVAVGSFVTGAADPAGALRALRAAIGRRR